MIIYVKEIENGVLLPMIDWESKTPRIIAWEDEDLFEADKAGDEQRMFFGGRMAHVSRKTLKRINEEIQKEKSMDVDQMDEFLRIASKKGVETPEDLINPIRENEDLFISGTADHVLENRHGIGLAIVKYKKAEKA